MAQKYDSDEWGEDCSDGEDESQLRHAHHPASSSRETVEITTVKSKSVRFDRSLWEHAGSARSAVHRSASILDGPTGSRRSMEMSLEDVINRRRKRFGSGQGSSTEVRKDENMSLSEIIKSRKIEAPPKLPGRNVRNQQKGQKRTRWDQNSTAKSATEEFVVEYEVEEEATTYYNNDGGVIEGDQVRKKSKRMEKKEVTFTPESGIRLLLEKGFVIGVRVYGLISKDGDTVRRRRWRACYFDGREVSTEGVGEGATKVLARECAALDFIEKLGRRRPDLKIPRCEIPKGCRVVPAVMKALEGLCDRLDLGEPYYSEELVMHGGREKYRFRIHIGDYDFAGTSYNLKYARNKAAKKAYDSLNDTGRVFQLEPITKGDHCSDGSCFSLVDAEEMHILNVNRPFPKKAPSASYIYTPVNGAKNAEKVVVSPVSTFVMSPSLMQIRQFIQSQKSGGVQANAEFSSQTDPSGQEAFFETGSEPEPFSSPEHLKPVYFRNPLTPSAIVASSSRASLFDERNLVSPPGRADDGDYFSTQYIERFWESQLRGSVFSFLKELETYPSGDGAEDVAKSEDGIDGDATSMAINVYGSSASFKVATSRAKSNLSFTISSIEEAFSKLTSASRRSAMIGGIRNKAAMTSKKNPFY